MKHATAEYLKAYDGLLNEVRTFKRLREKKPGSFYLGGKGLLHFHENQACLFADLKAGLEFVHYPVNTAKEQAVLLRAISALP